MVEHLVAQNREGDPDDSPDEVFERGALGHVPNLNVEAEFDALSVLSSPQPKLLFADS